MSEKNLFSSIFSFVKNLFSSKPSQAAAPLKPRIVGEPKPESEETAISMTDFEGYIKSQPMSMDDFAKNLSN